MSFMHHEPCPQCGSRDNLARYEDGGAFCFGCHYQEKSTKAPSRFFKPTLDSAECSKSTRAMPDDVGYEFGGDAVTWLTSFHMDVPTAIRRGLVWSPSREQLIFKLGNVWQARNFNAERRARYGKCYTQGDVNECLHIYAGDTNPVRGLPLVIVEDPVSAIRCAETGLCDAMPLLGSHLATSRLNALKGLYNASKWVFWLDSDKFKESVTMCDRARLLGLSSSVIYTDDDPKCFTNDQLKELLK